MAEIKLRCGRSKRPSYYFRADSASAAATVSINVGHSKGDGEMTKRDMTTQMNDKLLIAQLLQDWGTWRDSCDFEKLRGCYTEDATMVTSWYDGAAKGFIDACVQMHARQPSQGSAMHLIGGTTAEVADDRAFAETRITLLTRGTVHGCAVDVTVYGRFLDFLVKRDGKWLIDRREPIYDKDMLQPVSPREAPELDPAELAKQPQGFRHMAYVQSAAGLRINSTIPDPKSEAEQSLYARGRRWLTGQAA